MPNYTFRDIKTGEEITLTMKIAELDPFLKKNKKKYVQVLSKMTTADPWLLDGVKKPPSDFSKYVLGKVKHGVPGATIEQGRFHVPKEV